MNKIDFLQQNNDWSEVSGSLQGEFNFATFAEVDRVVRFVLDKATEINHHPKVTFGYSVLKVQLSTHDAGNAVTELDITFAQSISDFILNLKQA